MSHRITPAAIIGNAWLQFDSIFPKIATTFCSIFFFNSSDLIFYLSLWYLAIFSEICFYLSSLKLFILLPPFYPLLGRVLVK